MSDPLRTVVFVYPKHFDQLSDPATTAVVEQLWDTWLTRGGRVTTSILLRQAIAWA
ncbi:hypothetical protein OAI33_00850 [Pirellulaceae bacterium]|nr:hypothetical protein [Pirellulaceae bacterium]